MRSLEEMLERTEGGALSKEELSYIVNRIERSRNKEDPELYLLILILGEAGAKENRKLVECFLSYPSNPTISAVALQTLVSYWDFMEEYARELKTFVRGVDWDQYEDVRIVAVSAAGRYLTGYQDKELLRELIEIFTNTTESDSIREMAYWALVDAVGRDPIKLMKAKEMDLTVLDEAIQMLG